MSREEVSSVFVTAHCYCVLELSIVPHEGICPSDAGVASILGPMTSEYQHILVTRANNATCNVMVSIQASQGQ